MNKIDYYLLSYNLILHDEYLIKIYFKNMYYFIKF